MDQTGGHGRRLRVGMLTGSLSATGGGVAECVRALAGALEATGTCEVVLFTLDGHEAAASGNDPGTLRVHVAKVTGPGSFGYSADLGAALAEARLDVLHVHGIWMYMSVAALRWSRRSGRPYVVSPHGMLDPWAVRNSGWKKIIAGALYENRHLRGAACLHALCEPELAGIRAYGLSNPVCTIPNGVAPAAGVPAAADWRATLPATARVLLYLGRLHPKKGAHDLIAAWHDCAGTRSRSQEDWHLVIAGPGAPDYVGRLEGLVASLGLRDSVHLVGPQFGAAKAASFAASDAFVLPSLSEGQPMAVLEAWSHGLPALLTPDCNLPEGFEAGAAVRISPGREGIAVGLGALFSSDAHERSEMGLRGRALVETRFNWGRSAEDLEAVYRWVCGSASRPGCVVTSESAQAVS